MIQVAQISQSTLTSMQNIASTAYTVAVNTAQWTGREVTTLVSKNVNIILSTAKFIQSTSIKGYTLFAPLLTRVSTIAQNIFTFIKPVIARTSSAALKFAKSTAGLTTLFTFGGMISAFGAHTATSKKAKAALTATGLGSAFTAGAIVGPAVAAQIAKTLPVFAKAFSLLAIL